MEEMELHPDFPVVNSKYQMTKNWSVVLPGSFSKRIEDGSLILWRLGFTIWTNVWGNDHSETPDKRLNDIVQRSNKSKFDEIKLKDKVLLYSYRIHEDEDDDRVAAFYCFAFGKTGHVQMAIYFDKEEDVSWANKIWRSLDETI